MRYEPGMQIIWDVIAREVTVIFRGQVFNLLDRFSSREIAIAMAEERCRSLGWEPVEALAA
jgi:hypothetical protein